MLTILYAMLAALTGISVGEPVHARTAVINNVASEQLALADKPDQQKVVRAAEEVGRAIGRAVRRHLQPVERQEVQTPRVALAWIDFERRHQ